MSAPDEQIATCTAVVPRCALQARASRPLQRPEHPGAPPPESGGRALV